MAQPSPTQHRPVDRAGHRFVAGPCREFSKKVLISLLHKKMTEITQSKANAKRQMGRAGAIQGAVY